MCTGLFYWTKELTTANERSNTKHRGGNKVKKMEISLQMCLQTLQMWWQNSNNNNCDITPNTME